MDNLFMNSIMKVSQTIMKRMNINPKIMNIPVINKSIIHFRKIIKSIFLKTNKIVTMLMLNGEKMMVISLVIWKKLCKKFIPK